MPDETPEVPRGEPLSDAEWERIINTPLGDADLAEAKRRFRQHAHPDHRDLLEAERVNEPESDGIDG